MPVQERIDTLLSDLIQTTGRPILQNRLIVNGADAQTVPMERGGIAVPTRRFPCEKELGYCADEERVSTP